MIVQHYDESDLNWIMDNRPIVQITPVQGKTSIYQIMTGDKQLRDVNENFLKIESGILQVAFVDNDSIDQVKAIIQIAKDGYVTRPIISDDLITVIKFSKDAYYITFPEKQAKEQQLKAGAKETLLQHLNIEKQLNIELI
jgi:AmiR/NasT family two-component response regulator